MTREEATKFWEFRYENAKDFSDPHWDAQERREHREYVEALRMAIEALQAEPTHGRLIDADALYASIAKDTYLLTDRINSRDYGMFLVGIKEKIDNAPTVQADRPHGEWIADTESMTLNCSLCDEQFKFDDVDEMLDYKEYAYFCINCGADMREENK